MTTTITVIELAEEQSGRSEYRPQPVNIQTIDMTGKEYLCISYISEDITVREHGNKTLELREYMENADSRYLAQLDVTDDTVSIRNGRRETDGNLQAHAELLLPAGYGKNLDIFSLSGDIDVNLPRRYKKFRAESVSGDISLHGVSAETLCVKTTSGDIDIEGAEEQGDEIHYKIKTASGDISVQQARGYGTFESTSGNLELDFRELLHSLHCSAVSGDIEIQIPEGTRYALHTSTLSGDIEVPEEEQLCGEQGDEFIIRLSTVSGDIGLNHY